MNSRIITPARFETVVSYSLEFRWRDEPSAGFSFPCDEAGRVDMSMESLSACLAGKGVGKGWVERHERMLREPAVLRCDCGRKVSLWSAWANGCDCGREYNGSGALLAPRADWGEETGESFA